MQPELERAVLALERIADGLEGVNRLLSYRLAVEIISDAQRTGYTWEQVLDATLGGAEEILRRCDGRVSTPPAPAP